MPAGGAGQTVDLTATAIKGFSGTVTVAITGLPTGIVANPATLTLTPGVVKTVTLTAGGTATTGTSTITFTGTSGTSSHTATVSVTVFTPPPPDSSLTLSPTSLLLTAGGPGASVSVTANAINAFTGAVAVAITGLPVGVTANPASLNLTPGAPQSTTLTAAATAAAGMATVIFTGTSGSLSHAATLALTIQMEGTTTAPDVITFHYDNARDGLNAAETILTTSNVNSTQFGKIGFDAVDGVVDAQPLYVANLTVNGALRNVLYVATERDSVYAFDADTGTQLWKTSVLDSGETTSGNGCVQINPEIGITSTPVIDRKRGANGTLFAVGMSQDASGNYHQRLHALDLTTGAEISGSPTEISATYPGSGDNSQNGNVVFDPGQYAERAALLLLNGSIYLSWTSHCDTRPYTGWVMSYSETTLKQNQVLNLTPNGGAGGIWMAGDGPAADRSGNIYLLDANGTFDLGFDSNGFPAMGDFGNGIIKLSLNSTGTLVVADFFEPYNTGTESDADLDLGSGGEILLPDLTDASGKTRQLIVGAGKDGHIYVADRNNLGKFNSRTTNNTNLYQDVSGAQGAVFSTPAYFNGVIYYAAFGDTLRAFPMIMAKLVKPFTSQSATTFAYPGATPSISANGNESGIVWALESNMKSPAVLHAYDANNLGNELYNSNQAAGGRDSFGNGNKFIPPMIVNGKVYVGTPSGVAVFGLLSP
jgi:outer membrane protein assembly factor BamB